MAAQFQVQVPLGVYPGMALQVQTPDGQLLQVVVPPGVAPGMPMLVSYEPLHRDQLRDQLVNSSLSRIAQSLVRVGGPGTYCVGGPLETLFMQLDADRNGTLDYREMEAILLRFQPDLSRAELGSLFGRFDRDGSGKIDIREFRRTLDEALFLVQQGMYWEAAPPGPRVPQPPAGPEPCGGRPGPWGAAAAAASRASRPGWREAAPAEAGGGQEQPPVSRQLSELSKTALLRLTNAERQLVVIEREVAQLHESWVTGCLQGGKARTELAYQESLAKKLETDDLDNMDLSELSDYGKDQAKAIRKQLLSRLEALLEDELPRIFGLLKKAEAQ